MLPVFTVLFGNMTNHLNLKFLKNKNKFNLNQNYGSDNDTDGETSRFFKVIDRKAEEKNNSYSIAELGNASSTVGAKIFNKVDGASTSESNNQNNVHKKSDWLPCNWENQLNNIKKMRSNFSAPVDVMGCHKCSDKLAGAPVFRFQSLVALMLSSQTKDQITYEAMKRLKEMNCCPKVIASMTDEELGKLIYPVSFWKRKVQYLKKTTKILLEDYNGDIPEDVESLCKLPGVGPKMAHICMLVAWNKISGIGVDTHVHRISNRLGWVQSPTKNPEETRIALESWLPKELWPEINHLFVGFGQEICQQRNPKCTSCYNYNICPFVTNKYKF